MLASALTGTPPSDIPPDVLAVAIEHYQTVQSYRVTIRSSHADGEDHILYHYKKPGFIRMEFIKPHKGAVLIYNPGTQRVRLWPFGANRFPELNLSPDNSLIKSPRGQRVDHSDIGALFENVRTLQQNGRTEVSDSEGSALRIVVTGTEGTLVAGVHRYELWLDTVSQFPRKVISRDQQDAIIETVLMENLEINIALPEAVFNP